MGADESLLERVAAAIKAQPEAGDGPPSLLASSSASYGIRPANDETLPSGFDPAAAALFEAVVESAFLVANADGEFDDTEQRAFRQVVVAACGGLVVERQLAALLADLHLAFAEDGLDRRIAVVTRCVTGPEQAREVLRVAALIAAISGGVSEIEHLVLRRLAVGLSLGAEEVDRAVAAAQLAIGVTSPHALD